MLILQTCETYLKRVSVSKNWYFSIEYYTLLTAKDFHYHASMGNQRPLVKMRNVANIKQCSCISNFTAFIAFFCDPKDSYYAIAQP
jgi:hypothetical protein